MCGIPQSFMMLCFTNIFAPGTLRLRQINNPKHTPHINQHYAYIAHVMPQNIRHSSQAENHNGCSRQGTPGCPPLHDAEGPPEQADNGREPRIQSIKRVIILAYTHHLECSPITPIVISLECFVASIMHPKFTNGGCAPDVLGQHAIKLARNLLHALIFTGKTRQKISHQQAQADNHRQEDNAQRYAECGK